MENPNLYEDDLTDERNPTPAQIEEASHDVKLDPDILASDDTASEDDDEEDDDDEDDDEDEDLDD